MAHLAHRDRKELKLLLLLALAFACVDIVLGMIAPYLSGSLRHIDRIPMVMQSARTEQAVLFMGNSLSNNAVQPEVIRAQSGQPDAAIAKVVPDGSALWDWRCLIDNQLLTGEGKPRALVLGFAWRQLSDQARHSPTELGAHFCHWSDAGFLRRHGMTSVGEFSEFGLAKISNLYALRDTLRNRILDLIVPDYQRFTQESNVLADSDEAQSPTPAKTFSYDMLRAVAAQLAARDIPLVLMALPVQADYEIDPELREIIATHGVTLLDYRDIGVSPGAHFLDSMHVNAEGAAIVSAALARDLAHLLDGETR